MHLSRHDINEYRAKLADEIQGAWALFGVALLAAWLFGLAACHNKFTDWPQISFWEWLAKKTMIFGTKHGGLLVPNLEWCFYILLSVVGCIAAAYGIIECSARHARWRRILEKPPLQAVIRFESDIENQKYCFFEQTENSLLPEKTTKRRWWVCSSDGLKPIMGQTITAGLFVDFLTGKPLALLRGNHFYWLVEKLRPDKVLKAPALSDKGVSQGS